MKMTGTTKLRPGMSRKEAVRAFYAIRKDLALAENEIQMLKEKIKRFEAQLVESNEDTRSEYEAG